MLRKVVIAGVGVIVVLAAVVLGLAATKPDAYRVERSADIAAPPEEIYGHIADLHRWAAWSPWERIDPAMQRTFSGAESGTGAVYEWAGNSDIGKGRMEIEDTTPPNRLALKLEFLEPFESQARVDFTLEPAGGGTRVTWAMEGQNLFVGKVIGVFVDMDRMIGDQYELGLANLKTLAEK
jgi:uncharacterized protein YndB with AHSA1/START domain